MKVLTEVLANHEVQFTVRVSAENCGPEAGKDGNAEGSSSGKGALFTSWAGNLRQVDVGPRSGVV
jgi:hypothetical protein